MLQNMGDLQRVAVSTMDLVYISNDISVVHTEYSAQFYEDGVL